MTLDSERFSLCLSGKRSLDREAFLVYVISLMQYQNLLSASESLSKWFIPVCSALATSSVSFEHFSAHEIEYEERSPNDQEVLKLDQDVLVVLQASEEANDSSIEERFLPKVVVTEIVKKGRIGVGHRQSYGHRSDGMPNLKSIVESVLKRVSGSTNLKKSVPEMLAESTKTGSVVIHIGSVIVSPENEQKIREIISNDLVYCASNRTDGQ